MTSSVELFVPSPDDLAQLLQLAQDGRLKKLAAVAQTLEEQDTRYAPFLKHIIELTSEFQVEKIEAFIQQFTYELSNTSRGEG